MIDYILTIIHEADKHAVESYCLINDFIKNKDKKKLEMSKENISQLDEILSTLEIELKIEKEKEKNDK